MGSSTCVMLAIFLLIGILISLTQFTLGIKNYQLKNMMQAYTISAGTTLYRSIPMYEELKHDIDCSDMVVTHNHVVLYPSAHRLTTDT